jgi:hypothetical protein
VFRQVVPNINGQNNTKFTHLSHKVSSRFKDDKETLSTVFKVSISYETVLSHFLGLRVCKKLGKHTCPSEGITSMQTSLRSLP